MTALLDVLFRIGWITRRLALRPENVSVRGAVSRDARPGRVRAPHGRLTYSAISVRAKGHLDARIVAVDGKHDVEDCGKNEWHGREDTSVRRETQALPRQRVTDGF